MKDGRGWTALLNAAFNEHKEIVNILLENNADVNLMGHYYSPLIAASEKGYKDIVTLLLQKNANINVKGGPELMVLWGEKGCASFSLMPHLKHFARSFSGL